MKLSEHIQLPVTYIRADQFPVFGSLIETCVAVEYRYLFDAKYCPFCAVVSADHVDVERRTNFCLTETSCICFCAHRWSLTHPVPTDSNSSKFIDLVVMIKTIANLNSFHSHFATWDQSGTGTNRAFHKRSRTVFNPSQCVDVCVLSVNSCVEWDKHDARQACLGSDFVQTGPPAQVALVCANYHQGAQSLVTD